MSFDNSLVREWLNGSLVPLTANLVLVIGMYIAQCFAEARRRGVPWHSIPGVQTAVALFWIFGAETLRAAFVFVSLRTKNDGHELPAWWSQMGDVLLVLVTTILAAAVLRCTYVFTPPSIRRYFWICSLIVTIAFVLISHNFPQITLFVEPG